MTAQPGGRSRPARWGAGAMAGLIVAAFLIAGLVLGARNQDGVVAATAATLTLAAPAAPSAPGAPLAPAPGGAGRPCASQPSTPAATACSP